MGQIPKWGTWIVGRISSSARTEFNRLWIHFTGRLLYSCFNHYISSRRLKCLAWYVTFSLSLSFFFDNPWFCTVMPQPSRTKFEYRTDACSLQRSQVNSFCGVLKDFREWQDYLVTDFVLAFVTVNVRTFIVLVWLTQTLKNRKKKWTTLSGSRFFIDTSDDNCENGFIISNFPEYSVFSTWMVLSVVLHLL